MQKYQKIQTFTRNYAKVNKNEQIYKKQLSLINRKYHKAPEIKKEYHNLCKNIIKYKNLPEITLN